MNLTDLAVLVAMGMVLLVGYVWARRGYDR